MTLLVAKDSAECSKLAAFAQALGGGYDLLCLSGSCPDDLGAGKAISTDLDVPADGLAKAIAPMAENYEVVAGLASMFGKDWLPRLAAILDRPMVSDITEVVGERQFVRPMVAGNVLATVEVTTPKFVATVRGSAFGEATRSGTSEAKQVQLSAEGAAKRTAVEACSGGRPDLAQARIVVSGGRPLKDAATFERLIGGLADVLGGAVGATRAAVDNGIATNDLQVGQTGKVVAPDLYIAVGISGSTQHMAGMKDSKTIVAINTDPDAPIFEIADYGLVQDLYVAVPEMIEKLRSNH
jgi:electron transfer flavoprotein alpha subunit